MSLPSELWILIASGLFTPIDLSNLCVTSSRLLHIIRPFLYRNVELKAAGPQSNASHALELLAHNKPLAKCVVELTLERRPPLGQKDFPVDDLHTRPSLIKLDAIANMVSLKRVALYGPIFLNTDEQNEFGCLLAPRSDISLEELTYVAENEELPADRIGDIGGLKKLYWNGGTLKRIEPLRNILPRSLTTLHTLSLPFDLCMPYNNNHLWTIHFPNLRSVTLGSWENEEKIPPHDVLDFILPHSNTIETLDLEYYKYGDAVEMISGSSWLRLQTNFLPHLHSLRGRPQFVESFAIARINCLSNTLCRLAIRPGSMQAMFSAISNPRFGNGPPVGHLLALQEIELGLYELGKAEWREVVEIIQQCASCCPSVEVWRGTLPSSFKMDAEVLCRLFGLFKNLRVVYICEDNILGPEWRWTRDEQEEHANQTEHDGEEAEVSEEKMVESEPKSEGEEAEETDEKMFDETLSEDDACGDSTIEAFVHMLALHCLALQNVSVQRTYPLKDWWTISRTWDPARESRVCSLGRRTIEEHELERSGEKKSSNHWIHAP